MTGTPLDYALSYAASGFPVMPLHTPVDGRCDCRRACDSPGKHPRTAHGLTDATTDADTIRRWWAMWPTANVGLAMPPGYVTADIDTENVASALNGHGTPPATALQKTGRGWHFVYRTATPIRPKVHVLEHVDLRGHGSYIVAEPSIHVSGARYTWVSGLDEGIADAPDWIVEAGSAPPTVDPTAPGEPIPEGRRNDTLARMAGAMRHQGMTGDEIAVALLAVNGRAGLDEAEVRAIAASVARYAPGERGPVLVLKGEAEVIDDGLAGMDAADLMELDMPDLEQAIEGLLTEGLGVIGAPPKAGKSLLCYQMGVALRLGTDLLGCKGSRRAVRYYALEDGRRRSKARIAALLGGARMPRGLELRWTAPRLGGDLEAEIATFLDEHPGGVVIVDVLGKVRAQGKAGLNAYDEDYSMLTRLHTVTRSHPGSVVLLVTHDRKAGSDDWMTRITGTRGVTGAADFVIFINRRRGEDLGSIVVTGRDIPDSAIDVRFTGSGWLPADIELVIGTRSQTRQVIFGWLKEHGPAWQKAIAEGTGLAIATVHVRVADMARDGEIVGGPVGYGVPQ